MTHGNDPDSLRKLLCVVQGGVQAANTAPPAESAPAPVQISYGSQSVQISGSVVNVYTGQLSPPPSDKDTVDAAQKQEIGSLLRAWVRRHNSNTTAKPLTVQQAWLRFHERFRINTYHALPAARFVEATQWLRSQLESVTSPPSSSPSAAKRKVIAFIKTACKKHFGDEFFYVPYIRENFGKDGLNMLNAAEMEQVRAFISGIVGELEGK